ncbi:DUF6660 family protein [Tunicatimonas sp.]|uniref:DUF6660 family protein n=1 Tax=Tunicatimonas sp. TaxID=1940096 RepID=UPI003C73904E
MKIRALLLSALVLSIGLVPCSESFAVSNSPSCCLDHESSEESDHTDACSPFCVCHCYPTFAIFNLPTYSGDFIFLKLQLSEAPFHFIERFSFDIWHPPRCD